jgi:hypothetical protein
VDVGVLGLVEAHDSVDDLLRLLRRRRGVEIDEAFAVGERLEDREVLPDGLDVETHLLRRLCVL